MWDREANRNDDRKLHLSGKIAWNQKISQVKHFRIRNFSCSCNCDSYTMCVCGLIFEDVLALRAQTEVQLFVIL